MIKVYEQNNFSITYCDDNLKSVNELKNNDNILLLSGGIDSQSVLSYLKQNSINVTTFFCDYGYNVYDKSFAERIGIDILYSIDLDKFFFEQNKHLLYYDLYKCTSPQLAIHIEMLEFIREKYPKSNVIMPGMPPFYNLNEDRTIANSLPDYCQLTYYRYKQATDFANFIPYFLIEFDILIKIINSKHQLNFDIIDYEKKILLYQDLNLEIVPQEFKKTGFEEYKRHLKKDRSIIFDEVLRKPINKNKKSIGIFSDNILPQSLIRKINE